MPDLIAMQAAVLAVVTFTILFFDQGLAGIENRLRSILDSKDPALAEKRAAEYMREVFPNIYKTNLTKRVWRAVTYTPIICVAAVDLYICAITIIHLNWGVIDPASVAANPNASQLAKISYWLLVALTVLVALGGLMRTSTAFKRIRKLVPSTAVQQPGEETPPGDARSLFGPLLLLLLLSRTTRKAGRREPG